MSAVYSFPDLVTEDVAAKMLGMTRAALTKERMAGRVPHMRFGARTVRYNPDDIEEHMLFHAMSVETLVDQAIGLKQEVEVRCGVYFLWSGDEVVYIGRSARFHTRLASHLLTAKEFDSYAFVPVHPKLLNRAEEMLIRHFQPRHNVMYVEADK